MVKTSLLVLLIVQGQPLLWVDAFSPRAANSRIHPLRTYQSPLEKCNHLHIRRRRTDVLPSNVVNYASVPSFNDFAAGGTLLLSSMIGILSEKLNFKGGHVVTLITAAFLSNTSRVVPTDHILYDLCWSIFLPASLVFALLSTASASEELTGSSTSSATEITSNVNNSILGMALPFAAGSIGSVIGCCVSFFMCKFHDVKATAILAGCLCASYIGGTVNFFAAAKILMPMFNCDSTSGRDGGIGSLFGSLAAADLVVMAIYFAVLSFASNSTLLKRLFPNRNDDDESSLSISNDVMATSDSLVSHESLRESSRKDSTIYASLGSTATAVIGAFLVSLLTVLAATDLEMRVNNLVPGTMCAFLAIFGLISERLVGIGLKRNQKRSCKSFLAKSLEKVPLVSPTLSSMCFYILFASIGTTADVASAVASGPTALVFASMALAIHFTTVLVATFVGGRLSRRTKKCPLPQTSLQEMLTASNAAIGGPSTAAAFAADLVPITPSSRGNIQLRRSLVLGATFWGVFGYAIGTATGVSIAKALMRWV